MKGCLCRLHISNISYDLNNATGTKILPDVKTAQENLAVLMHVIKELN